MAMEESVVVVDLGAAFVRAGVVHGRGKGSGGATVGGIGGGAKSEESMSGIDVPQPHVEPNLSAKAKGTKGVALGDEVLRIADVLSLVVRRPMDRGYLVNADLEAQILDRVFYRKDALALKETQGASLLCTEPLFALPAVQRTLDELVFERYSFGRMLAAPAPHLTAYADACGLLGGETFTLPGVSGTLQGDAQASVAVARAARCGVVLDAGFSFTHAVPFSSSRVLLPGVRRLNFGGKAMTNLLKELVSYRSVNMMDETYIMDDVKEKMCFVAQDLGREAAEAKKAARSEHYGEYVLPDGVQCARGYVREKRDVRAGKKGGESDDDDDDDVGPALDEQCLPLCNERFMTPEVLFNPSDIGIAQAGVHELVTQAVEAVTKGRKDTTDSYRGLLYSNVILSGGCVTIPGFAERFNRELRALVPNDTTLHVRLPGQPQCCAYIGGVALAASHEYNTLACTREEYFEHGSDRLRRPLLPLISESL